MRENLQRLDESAPLVARATDGEAEHRATAERQQPLRNVVIGMPGKLRITHRLDERMADKKSDDLARIVDVALHAQRQGLDALQDVERRRRRHAGAEIAYTFAPCAQKKRRSRRLIGKYHVMEASIRLGQRRKFS